MTLWNREAGRRVRIAYLHDADLIGNRRDLKLETLVTDLEYADDMALLPDNWSDLTSTLDSLFSCCKKLGFIKKTKTLALLPADDTDALSPVSISLVPGGDPVEVVPHFQYLDSFVQSDWGLDVEINSTICKASDSLSVIV